MGNGMEICIVGLVQSGKTTVFQALTRHGAGGASAYHVGVTKVPDPRLDTLAQMFQPQKVVLAEITYRDPLAEPAGREKGGGIGGQQLSLLQQADALLLVVRAFEDPSVPHPQGSVDPYRDLETMGMELAFSDLGILERRAQRIEASLKGAKPPQREALHRELALLQRIRQRLEGEAPLQQAPGTALRQQPPFDKPFGPPQGKLRAPHDPEEERLLANYQLLTAKPLLALFNIGEELLPGTAGLEEELARRYDGPGVKTVALCGKLEEELAELEPEEEREFRASLGLEESGAARVVRRSYELLGLVSFFTVVSREVRAWSVPR
ncbi:MAG: redox-regulated ATPase YchF, partial [Dehalococcoidia bacterium]